MLWLCNRQGQDRPCSGFSHRESALSALWPQDWNLELHELPQTRSLLSKGFVEIQDIRSSRQGIAPEVTCKNRTRKDFVFVSAELLALFVDAQVDPTYWADHSVVSARFRLPDAYVHRFTRRAPLRRTKPSGLQLPQVSAQVGADPTTTMSNICSAFEDAWSLAERQSGRPPLSSAERGRGCSGGSLQALAGCAAEEGKAWGC